ncbi:hypothetical protein ACWEP8_24280 [Streptomyces hydrogenans]
MRRGKWAAAAAGVVLLVAGCGGEGGADSGSASSGGSGAKGVKLDAATVSREIDTAATAAGFTKDPEIDTVAPELKECMVNWAVDDPGKAADPEKALADTIAGLVEAGWTEGKGARQGYADVKTLTKGEWTIKSASDLGKGIKAVVFAGTHGTPECAALVIADMEKKKS